MTPVSIVAYLALFVGVGLVFLFVNLLVGKFVRPHDPHAEKLEVYECGEPTIGSSFVQFDLRFYVVALLFIIFDVEVAFFFPWANVFGKSTHLMDDNFRTAAIARATETIGDKPTTQWTDEDRRQVQQTADGFVAARFRELGVTHASMDRILEQPSSEARDNLVAVQQMSRSLARMSLIDIGVFFAVLMVGFFYVWRRGDLDWVRAVSRERASMERTPLLAVGEEAHALSA
jgi:NADH-quinone oxidoreductase subunit A